MGKKARLKRERQEGRAPQSRSATQLTDGFCRAIGAPGTIADPATFWDWLDDRHGADSAYVSDVLDRVVTDSKWGARCATLRLSIDFQFGFSGRLYRPLLRALATRLSDRGYRSVADLGCENGLVSCFTAWLQPDCCVYGFDIERRSVEVARELAGQLGVQGQFFEGDITAREWPVTGPFDVVLAMRSLVGNALDVATADEDLTSVLARVSDVLNPGGTFIAFERLQDAEQSHAFAAAAAQEGLVLDAEDSAVLVVEEVPGSTERIPLLLFSKVETAMSPNVAVVRELHHRGARRARIA